MSESSPDPAANDPAKNFRIGHKERDEAIEVLREAAGDGRITVDQLDERMEQVQAARFPADLDPVLGDLTIDLPSDRFRQGPAGQGRTNPGQGLVHPRTGGDIARSGPAHSNLEGWDPRHPHIIRATWESTVRRGRWQVPPFLRCEPAASNIELNFLEAETDLKEIDIEVVAGMGSVTVVVPEDWGVNVDHLSSSWGSVKSTVNAIPDGARPTIFVDGSIGMGSFRARFANYFDRRRTGR